jgi:hypothetical protein
MQSPKRCVLNKNRTMDNLQKHNICVTQQFLSIVLINMKCHFCLQVCAIKYVDLMSLFNNYYHPYFFVVLLLTFI